jgi:hypothetical protein
MASSKITKSEQRLLLKLFRAGFPLREADEKTHQVIFPTLSEMIDEIVKKWGGFELWEEGDGSEKNRNYKAVVNYPNLEMARAKTHKLAVAELWLALNKKK